VQALNWMCFVIQVNTALTDLDLEHNWLEAADKKAIANAVEVTGDNLSLY
jgi:hypothetical protein